MGTIIDTPLDDGTIQRVETTTTTTIFTADQYAQILQAAQDNVDYYTDIIATMSPSLDQAQAALVKVSISVNHQKIP